MILTAKTFCNSSRNSQALHHPGQGHHRCWLAPFAAAARVSGRLWRPLGSSFYAWSDRRRKTEVAHRLAEFLFGFGESLVRFDMSGSWRRPAVSKLICALQVRGLRIMRALTERGSAHAFTRSSCLDEMEKGASERFVNILVLQWF